MKNVLVISPHPDDETLGCGGTLLNHLDNGDKINWLLMTRMHNSIGYTEEQINIRNKEIMEVADLYSFNDYSIAPFITTKLDSTPFSEIVSYISSYIKKVNANIIYIPFQYDVHSDHRIIYNASISSSKNFNNPSIEKIRVYETLSETEQNIDFQTETFTPNLWIDISSNIDKKIKIMKKYKSEIKEFPHPRSEKNILALANIRGSFCGCRYAESFITLKEIIL